MKCEGSGKGQITGSHGGKRTIYMFIKQLLRIIITDFSLAECSVRFLEINLKTVGYVQNIIIQTLRDLEGQITRSHGGKRTYIHVHIAIGQNTHCRYNPSQSK